MTQLRVIVTGGASGLGEGAAREIVSTGGQVALFDRNISLARQVADVLGADAIACEGDVTDAASVEAAIGQVQDRFGGLNGAVNCAGIATVGKTVHKGEPHQMSTFRTTIDVNLVGTFNVMRLAALAMQTNAPDADGGRGAIVNTASIAAFDGQKGQAAYAASKGGVVAMTLPAARDLGQSGIRVNTIAPGLFLTPMMEGLGPEMMSQLGQTVVFPKRLGRPQDYGRLAVFMLTQSYLNGETVRLDGAARLP